MRPLVYEYPADKHVRNISDEYMLGSFVLVAPVIAPGKEAREVYLPDGDWYDYYTGEKYSGGRYILADAPLDKVPVFIKAGAIIPVADGEIRSTEDITEDKISTLTYPGKGSFAHYQDDNETLHTETVRTMLLSIPWMGISSRRKCCIRLVKIHNLKFIIQYQPQQGSGLNRAHRYGLLPFAVYH